MSESDRAILRRIARLNAERAGATDAQFAEIGRELWKLRNQLDDWRGAHARDNLEALVGRALLETAAARAAAVRKQFVRSWLNMARLVLMPWLLLRRTNQLDLVARVDSEPVLHPDIRVLDHFMLCARCRREHPR